MDKAKAKKVVNIVVNVLLWIFVAFAALMTIVAIAATSNADKIPMLGGKYLLTVSSDSMKPAFKKGDLIFGKALTDEEKLQLDYEDVITYYSGKDINGDGAEDLVTHRIQEVLTNAQGEVEYSVQGDNREMSTVPETISASKVISVWTGGKMVGVGGFINVMQRPTGFLLIIVLPLGLLFGYQIFVFVHALVKAKNAGKRQISAADEELIKQRAVEEYLRAQAEKNGEAPTDGSSEAEVPPDSADGSSEAEVPLDSADGSLEAEVPPDSADGDESGDDNQ